MPAESKHAILLEDDRVRRWYEELRARSVITAGVYLRGLGYYCEHNHTSPSGILEGAADARTFKDSFRDFVRKLEKEGKAGSYIARFKKVINSWLRFNDINLRLNVNIRGEYQTPRIADERVPTKDELSSMLRKASPRGRVIIAMMAYSGLRPESLGDYEGTDGLKIRDFPELEVTEEGADFSKVPAQVIVRPNLSKARHKYFTFLGEEGCIYIKEYLRERIRGGEKLTLDSPLLRQDTRGHPKNKFMRTTILIRDVRVAIERSALKFRPYVLRAYFATALDIAESKGLISGQWRQFLMGHKGNIEARYSTNKRLLPEMVDEMRSSYAKCLKFLETRIPESGESDRTAFLRLQLLKAVGYKQNQIDDMDLQGMEDEEFQKMLKDKITRAMAGNGHRQRLISINDIGSFLEEGYEVVTNLGNGNVVMKLPF